jgi:hypothetical protein
MREWIALGVREDLSFRQLAGHAGVHERTLRRWAAIFREESVQAGVPDRAERAFVELIECSDVSATRIEIVMPGGRRSVIDATAIVEALVRVILAVERC